MCAVRGLAVVGTVWLCVLAGGLVFGGEGASAGVTHEYLSQITEVPAHGPAPGEEPIALPGRLSNVYALTVDAGALYVADDDERVQSSYRLDTFDASSNAFLSQFAQVPALSYLHDGVAVGHAAGETQVYVGGDATGSLEGTVGVFAGSGSLLGAFKGADTPSGAFGCFECGRDGDIIAVDGSASLGDWAAGDVYVADSQHGAVDVFKPLAGGGEEYLARVEDPEAGAPLLRPTSVAVNQSNGNVVVVDRRAGGDVVDVFEPVSGMPGVYRFLFKIAGTPTAAFGTLAGLAVDGGNGEIYVSEAGNNGVVDQFSPAGVYLGQLTSTPAGGFGGLGGLAVDPSTHRVYVADFHQAEGGAVDVFGPDLTIPDVVSEPASEVSPAGATLNGTVNPDGVALTDCRFVYGTSSAYGQSAPCAQTPAEIGSGGSPVAVSAALTSLAPGVYHYRLIATNENGSSEGRDRVFGLPSIRGESSSAETKTTATLQAQVNPDGLDTAYRFEYGATSSYGTSVPVPDGDIGAGEGDVPLSAELAGLQAGVTYHYRVVAVNAAGTTRGGDQTFTTIPPARIEGVTITGITAGGATAHAQIDPLGSDTTYHFEYGASASYGASVPIPDVDIGAGEGDVAVTQQLSGLAANTTYHVRVAAHNALGTAYSPDHTFVYDTRGGGLSDGRAYEMVTPPQKNGAVIGDVVYGLVDKVAEDGSRVMASSIQCFADSVSCTSHRSIAIGSSYEFSRTGGGWVTTSLSPPVSAFPVATPWDYSPNADTALFSMPTPPEGEDDFYARQADGALVDIGPVTPLGQGAQGPESVRSSEEQATADLSHVVWETVARWSFDATHSGFPSVYEYVGVGNAQPELVGVSGGVGSSDLISVCETQLAMRKQNGMWGLSADGSVVFFEAKACSSGSGVNAGVPVPANELYARIDGSRTVLISGRSPGDCTGVCQTSAPSDAVFVGASPDGSRVFFTSVQQLTDTASQGSENLYEYDFDNPAGHNLIDVSVGDTSGSGPRVAQVQAVSTDASHVYFTAHGVLTGGANAQGQVAREGALNLYVFERDAGSPAGRLAFVASLPSSDEEIVGVNGVGDYSDVTPDGRFLVFTSHGDLTSDDTSVSGTRQVFRYDARTGALIRLSVGEGGFNDNGNRSAATPCSSFGECSEDASIVQGFAGISSGRADSTMSHDGSFVFFQSPVALTPGALDDVRVATRNERPEYAQNVYEWHEGHVHLISDGRDATANSGQNLLCASGVRFKLSSVCLLGSDASGANVFFTTADALVGQDTDTEVDIYDARVCTTGDPCVSYSAPPTGCSGEACRGGVVGAPGALGAGTVSFAGPGNLAPPAVSVARPKAKHRAKPKRRKRGRKVRRRVRPAGRRAGPARQHGAHVKTGGGK